MPKGYRFNLDSLLLYHFAYDFLKEKRDRDAALLDLGAGCGLLGLMAKRDFALFRVSLLDILPQNCSLAGFNTQLNELSAEILCEDFLQHKREFFYDFLLSNPPFYGSRSPSKEPSLALAKDASSLPLDEMLRCANRVLKPGGELIFCYEALALAKVVAALELRRFGGLTLRFVHAKDKNARLILLRAKKGSKAASAVLAPLMDQELDEVYERTRLSSYDL